MSMSTSVYGIIPPDEKWKAMKAVWDACENADMDPPKEVSDFFGWDDPDDKGVLIDLEKSPVTSEYSTDSENGFEVDLSKLDKNIKILRFVNSY